MRPHAIGLGRVNPTTTSTWKGILAVLALACSSLVLIPTADAHWCRSNNHDGCNGHFCPSGRTHYHYTEHWWWWDHWCRVSRGTSTIAEYGETPNTYGESGLYYSIDGPFIGCEDLYTQPVHTYGPAGSASVASATATGGESITVTSPITRVTVTNTDPCWDGDYESGFGGGFFGHGYWATDATCGHGLNPHGPNVAVNDAVFGGAITFVVGEDDQSGPIIVTDPQLGLTICETDGSITPGDPATDPTADPDDCLSDPFVGTGYTCGIGGGDGGYWVFLIGADVQENGGLTASNPPTTGTITAF